MLDRFPTVASAQEIAYDDFHPKSVFVVVKQYKCLVVHVRLFELIISAFLSDASTRSR